MSSEPQNRSERSRFFLITTGVLLAIVVVGFARTFWLKGLFETPALPFYVHLHGVVLIAWFALLFVQTTLIAADRTDLHRRLGVVGLVWAVLVVMISAITNYLALPRLVSEASPAEVPQLLAEGGFLIFTNYAGLLFFISCVAIAGYFRRRPEIHKRLMLVASLGFIAQPIDRLLRPTGMEDVLSYIDLTWIGLIVAIIGADWIRRRRPHWVLLGGSLVMLLFLGIAGRLSTTPTAQAWVLSNVGTVP